MVCTLVEMMKTLNHLLVKFSFTILLWHTGLKATSQFLGSSINLVHYSPVILWKLMFWTNKKHNVFHKHWPMFTFDCESCCGAHPFGWKDDGAWVLQSQVRQGEAMHQPIGAHSKLVVWLYSDAILLPNTFHLCVGELHLEGCSLSFKGFLVR